MANNKVQLANGTVLIDITDTTADTSDVLNGKDFYLRNGVKSTGTLQVVNPASIANAFSTSLTYAVGDYVLYEDSIYQCNTAITTAGAWDSSKWDSIVLADELNEVVNRTPIIPKGVCDSTSTATVFTATVPGVTELRDGVCIWLTNGVITSASGCTLNINGLGAKPLYSSQSESTAITTQFNVNYTALLIYNTTRVSGGCWDYVYGYNTNTTYTPQSLGFGYGTCTTAGTTAAKVATLSSYTLVTNGMVSIKFANAVCANATLNVNSKGAKTIYYRGAAITDGIIKAGDIATFVYSTNYHLIAIDRAINSASDIEGLALAIKNVPNCDLFGIAGFTDYYYINADGVETANTEFKHTKVIPCLPNHTYKLTATSVSGNAGWYIRTHAYIDGVWSRQLAVTNVLSSGGQSIEQNVTLSSTENGITVSYVPTRLADAPVLVDSTIKNSYVSSNQGSANAGKFLVVGSDGTVTPTMLATWQATSY